VQLAIFDRSLIRSDGLQGETLAQAIIATYPHIFVFGHSTTKFTTPVNHMFIKPYQLGEMATQIRLTMAQGK
jgi:hypothetical protein